MSMSVAALKAKEIAKLINTALGQTSLTMASDKPPTTVVPTGELPIDLALGGGLPRGRITEIFGAPSSLKSYIGLCAIREAQRMGLVAALVDSEHTFDAAWARRIGVDTDTMLLQEPATGEEAFDTVEALVRAGVGIVVIDSVAGLLPQAEQTTRLAGKNNQPARLAQLMSTGLRKVTTANQDTALLWINQIREQVGVTFGNPEKPTGGRSLPYYASIRLNIRTAGKINVGKKVYDGDAWVDGKVQVAQKWKVVSEKNKLDRPHNEIFFTWLYDDGLIDRIGFLMAQAIEMGITINKGQMWDYVDAGGTPRRARGKVGLRKAITEDSALQALIEQRVNDSVSHGSRPLPNSGAGTLKPKSLKPKVPVHTQAPGAVASPSTAASKPQRKRAVVK